MYLDLHVFIDLLHGITPGLHTYNGNFARLVTYLIASFVNFKGLVKEHKAFEGLINDEI